jgi:hypothetical protein
MASTSGRRRRRRRGGAAAAAEHDPGRKRSSFDITISLSFFYPSTTDDHTARASQQIFLASFS